MISMPRKKEMIPNPANRGSSEISSLPWVYISLTMNQIVIIAIANYHPLVCGFVWEIERGLVTIRIQYEFIESIETYARGAVLSYIGRQLISISMAIIVII